MAPKGMQPMTVVQPTKASIAEFQKPEVRTAAQPRLRAWLKAVDGKVQTKQLKDLDYRVANILTSYPSANAGKCWAGQKRLAHQAGRSERTVRAALGRLQSQGLLMTRRRGQGRTSCYDFTIEGKLIFAQNRENGKAFTAQIRQLVAGQKRQHAAAKPLECNSSEENLSPSISSARGGEVIDLANDRTRTNLFDQFWAACNLDERGKKGPAVAEWYKLTDGDICEIASLLRRDRRIDLDGMWACHWLKQRRWDDANIRLSVVDTAASGKPIEGDLSGWRGWEQVAQDLIASLGPSVFEGWFGRTKVLDVSDGCVLLIAPSRFVANWIRINFHPQVLMCWRARDPTIARVEITVEPST